MKGGPEPIPVPAAFAPLLAGQKRQSSFIEYPKTGNPSFGFESEI